MDEGQVKCDFCNSRTYEDTVKMSLWEGERLIVIEDVPARVCERCMEQFYDDFTVLKIDLLRGRKFPLSEAKRVIEVPIFTLPEIKIAPERDSVERQDTSVRTLHGHPYDEW